MHPNRAAIFLTIVLALALTPPIRRWAQHSPLTADNRHEEKPLPSKLTERSTGRPALSALKQLADTLARDDATKRPPEELAAVCSALDADALVEFLGDERLWPRRPSSGPIVSDNVDLWFRLLRLAPLRTAALERLATLDLRRGMLSFPADAVILLPAAAKVNGALTFRVWSEIKEEWKLAENTQGQDFFRNNVYIEGIGLLPCSGIDKPTAEQEALAALSRGWSSSDPEGAWVAVETGEFDHRSPAALASMIKGLEEHTDWRIWSERVDSLEWPFPSMDELSSVSVDPLTDAATKLAQRWIRSDPDAALSWLSQVERSWVFPQGSWPINAFESGITSSGAYKFMSVRVPIYTAWLETDADACLEWFEEAPAPDDTLADIVRWTELKPEKKLQVLALVEDPDLKAELAVTLARKTLDSESMNDQKERSSAIIHALGRLDGLDETTSARILSLKETGR